MCVWRDNSGSAIAALVFEWILNLEGFKSLSAPKEMYCYRHCTYSSLNYTNSFSRRLNAWYRWLVKLNLRNLAICSLPGLAVTSATVIYGSRSLLVQPTADSREYSAYPVACACCSCQ